MGNRSHGSASLRLFFCLRQPTTRSSNTKCLSWGDGPGFSAYSHLITCSYHSAARCPKSRYTHIYILSTYKMYAIYVCIIYIWLLRYIDTYAHTCTYVIHIHIYIPFCGLSWQPSLKCICLCQTKERRHVINRQQDWKGPALNPDLCHALEAPRTHSTRKHWEMPGLHLIWKSKACSLKWI